MVYLESSILTFFTQQHFDGIYLKWVHAGISFWWSYNMYACICMSYYGIFTVPSQCWTISIHLLNNRMFMLGRCIRSNVSLPDDLRFTVIRITRLSSIAFIYLFIFQFYTYFFFFQYSYFQHSFFFSADVCLSFIHVIGTCLSAFC